MYNCLDPECQTYCTRDPFVGTFTPGVCQQLNSFGQTIICSEDDSAIQTILFRNPTCVPSGNEIPVFQSACSVMPVNQVGIASLTSCTHTGDTIPSTFLSNNTAAPSCDPSVNPQASRNPCCNTHALAYKGHTLVLGYIDLDMKTLTDMATLSYLKGACSRDDYRLPVASLLTFVNRHNCWGGMVADKPGGTYTAVSSQTEMVRITLTAGCTVPFDVNGNLSEWRNVGTCSNGCGNGTLSQQRTCTNPPPQSNGLNCTAQSLGPTERVIDCTGNSTCVHQRTDENPFDNGAASVRFMQMEHLTSVIFICMLMRLMQIGTAE